ncbi:MAG: DNA recombination protein RmuC [Alphaproteobacteria bacterium]|nr:DNA recombination protein RmuC [Alphaproteobacteria bacterium]
METPVLFALAGLAAGILLALLAGLAMRGRAAGGAEAERLGALVERLATAQAELGGRIAALATSAAASQAELQRSVNERLDAVGKRLGESLQESSERTGRTIGELKERLVVIDEAQRNLVDLSSQVVGLQDILDNKQRRGQFGEQILETLVQDALPPGVYEFQATLSNRNRADCLIRLPNPPGPIAIDSKFPLEAYRALQAAGDEAQRQQAARAFTVAIQKHVGDIAGRYIIPGETAEGALMFLPSEAIYAELHAAFPALVETARRARVWPVSPSTLMATLTSMRALMRDATMRQQAHLIQRQVGQLTEDVARLLERVDNLKRHFTQAEKDIREIEVSAGKIGRKAEQIGELEIEAPPAAPAIDNAGH